MKREVKMFSEGSVFPNLRKDFYGGIEPVRDNPPVVEYGFAFPVSVQV